MRGMTTTFICGLRINGLVLACAATIGFSGPAIANDAITVNVLGTVSGTLDGEQRAWKTISGEIDGESIHSASWDNKAANNNLSDMGQMMSQLMGNLGMEMGPEEQEQMQAMESLFGNNSAMQDMMGKNGSMANTMQQLFGGGGPDPITLNITGHDPSSRN